MSQSVLQDGKIFIGKSIKPEYLDLSLANRHGLVTGATGTGKTVTLQVLAEGFSRAGVPVFAADIKGDLSGIGEVGEPKDFLLKRAAEVGLDDYKNSASPVVFWDVFGASGHPIRATVEDMGPLLVSRMLDLNDVQEGVLNIAFRVASEEGLPLINLGDLRAIVTYVGSRAKELSVKYGNVAIQSAGAIQRRLLVLEEQGADHFFGEPEIDIWDLIRTGPDGKGVVNILSADKLMERPRLYAVFLLWLLTKLWQTLPEVGDQPKPRLVFFFDEAHLLFDDAPKALMERIEQIARLVRSKGVGVYFITQNPMDVPNSVSAQLGNRVQHALRAFTPQEQRAVRAAAETFRRNPELNTERVILELKVGEALVSTLENKGEPSIVQRTLIRPPEGRIGPVTDAERRALMAASPFSGKYDTVKNRESAEEMLVKRNAEAAAAKEADASGGGGWLDSIFGGGRGPTGRKRQGMGEMIGREVQRSLARTVASTIRSIIMKSIGMRR
ncbi:ATPase [Hyphomicrobium sulfonivorans]|uniref:ATPase n=1 Tax=Hyphomicrobium sulfonivorans TaxID=121290 RepID=A0A109BJR1_HYPSL|nr:helicase HerA-like domain-containing protein [Hyphomicrobium sulfonivorans]KWT70103.1 ATPase [Hyphomicrobium sulfonivorans]